MDFVPHDRGLGWTKGAGLGGKRKRQTDGHTSTHTHNDYPNRDSAGSHMLGSTRGVESIGMVSIMVLLDSLHNKSIRHRLDIQALFS